MSTLPDNEFDLEKLFLPAWAQEEPSSAKYAKYEGEEERPERRGGRRGPRPPRREGFPGPRREGERPRGERRGRPARGERGDRPGPRRGEPREFRERREPPPPPPEVSLTLLPEEKGVDSLARQIKMTGRAYPLFEIAQMILQRPERYAVVFSIKKNAEGQPIQPLFVCALDETLWLSEDEAVAHVLKKHFNTFYQAERTPTEPPKGKYTFVAQCGLSGVILGPPNHHDYQNQLRKLHAERFSRMPFEAYKSRVKIVRDEEVVKKWVDDQSWKTEYLCLNMPEPLRLGNMEAVTQHFREQHKDNIIKPVETHTLNGLVARNLRSSGLARLARSVWEDQRRFPLQIAMALSQQFAARGLQFFKVNKTVTHVSVARPHYLDLTVTPVSEGVKGIVEYINANPKCNRRQLIEALAPTPTPTPIPVVPVPASAEAAPAPAEAAPAGEAQPVAPSAPQPAEDQPTAEQTAVIADLHWLIHQGHVIEFATGVLETAKKPLPKPPKPQPKPAEPAPAAVPGAPSSESTAGMEGGPAEPKVEPAPAAAPETVAPESALPIEPATPVAEQQTTPPVQGTESLPSAEAVPAPDILPAPSEAVPGDAPPAPAGEAPAEPPPAPAPSQP